MMDWADREAAKIVDDFVANHNSDDLLRLQHSIAAIIRQVYEGSKPIFHPSGFAVIGTLLLMPSV
jgi:hypothetical protein